MILIWLTSCFYRFGCTCYLSCASTQSKNMVKMFVDVSCDKHDEDDDNSDEMVGSHERFSDDKKK